jgi:isochorismate synthase
MESSGFSSRLAGLAGQARERAAAGEGRVLVSLSERVSSFDSLSALENLYRSSRADTQLVDHVSAGCAYWAHPSEGFSIAGFGAAATFSPAGEGRFSNIDQDWRALLDGALIDDANASRAGVGPLLIGGFAFDPDGPGTDRWRGFPSAHMILPKVHVTSIRDESWITVSVIVEADSAIDLDALAELRGRFARSERITPLSSGDGQSSIRMADDLAEAQWCDIVSDAVDAIRGGDFQKVVLARSAHGETPGEINPFSVLRSLRSTHRHAFIFGYWRGSSAFVGASPERLVRLGNGHVSASSLAGTVRRGATREDDAALARELQTSAKDLAEHAVVRDMLREILTEVGENVESDDEPQLLTLSNVHHLHTEVEADLRAEYSLLDVVDRLHPTPAVGGTPRDAALDFIRDNERLDRGWYAAPVGWMDQSGGEFAVALRSGIVSGSEFTIFAGCGIVADSDPELEYAESVLKLQPMQSAIAASMANSIVDSRELALASEESE